MKRYIRATQTFDNWKDRVYQAVEQSDLAGMYKSIDERGPGALCIDLKEPFKYRQIGKNDWADRKYVTYHGRSTPGWMVLPDQISIQDMIEVFNALVPDILRTTEAYKQSKQYVSKHRYDSTFANADPQFISQIDQLLYDTVTQYDVNVKSAADIVIEHIEDLIDIGEIDADVPRNYKSFIRHYVRSNIDKYRR